MILDEADQAGLVVFDDVVIQVQKASVRASQTVLSEIRQTRFR